MGEKIFMEIFLKIGKMPHYKKKNFWVKKVKWSYISENMKKKFQKKICKFGLLYYYYISIKI